MLVSTKTVIIQKEKADEVSEVYFDGKTNLLELLNANYISISQVCGGHGICTTCRVFLIDGENSVSSKSEIEIEHSNDRGFTADERLCCQTEVFGSIEIRIPKPKD
jgi:ferredoxin